MFSGPIYFRQFFSYFVWIPNKTKTNFIFILKETTMMIETDDDIEGKLNLK